MEDGKGYSLLIVEDGKVNQRVLVDALQDTYTLYTAVSGHAALKMASKVRPHIILLDIILPDIDGFEVLKQLKEDEKSGSKDSYLALFKQKYVWLFFLGILTP